MRKDTTVQQFLMYVETILWYFVRAAHHKHAHFFYKRPKFKHNFALRH